MEYDLIATTTFGIEAITAKELKSLGYEDLKLENGRVSFQGDEMDIAISNIWLRTAERVLIKVAEFKATSFEELFKGTEEVDWGKYIPQNGFMHVNGKSVKSTLYSVPDCQSIVKKAIVKSMQRTYNTTWFPEDGPTYKIEVAILKDVVTLTIDTSGQGLHKRGYRENSGEAPLKETLAASMVLLSKWKEDRFLVDPFCGSGTILIEAALIGANIAPGLHRNFVCETWPSMDEEVFKQVREGAEKSIKKPDMQLIGFDINDWVLKTARRNAEKAKVREYIDFQKLDFNEFSSKKKYGYIITNPPYGERIGEKSAVEALNRRMGKVKKELDTWDFNILTAAESFQNLFGRKATKNRKLYNGRLLCYYYQYLDNELK
ncbi:putative N6-adenine-specific DNA methylase [Clostridium cavendishii DSM 21758]|uniref:Putative N6-adenine-specific DNA methylase n=1 Tax=Clostridium cavendishii DSM 21758 TaxID=1121302 RepID=A0A1M6KN54_9CLOT|nr:class I SAM-dependent RNA methyltransferase [Clostridium cavendishii]SHJ60326.1 putative N6-adenine-specific DNA methylase [Clostridium cavendishii DSM 21758]